MEINKRKNLYYNPNNNEEFHQNNIYRNLELSMKIKKIITNSTNKKENKLKINTNNFMNSINNIVTENKKRIKQNQGELKTLLNYINNKVKLSDSQYTKKIPKKSEETSNKIDKKYDKKIKEIEKNYNFQIKNNNNPEEIKFEEEEEIIINEIPDNDEEFNKILKDKIEAIKKVKENQRKNLIQENEDEPFSLY